MAQYPDYGRCRVRSVFLARELEKEGFHPKVLYGIFTPSAPRYLWDDRWQKVQVSEFSHFWLAFADRFYDYSAFQFGERAPVKTFVDDPRYEELGRLNFNTGEMIQTGNYLIEWPSKVEEGVPILKLVPIFV